MRWVAKNAVAAGLAERLEVQVAYAIGRAEPVGLYVETFGTGHVDDETITRAIRDVFDLRPRRSSTTSTSCARSTRRLRRTATSAGSSRLHVGAHDRVDELRAAAGL
jgi:S-adenosylmethionine synthetase